MTLPCEGCGVAVEQTPRARRRKWCSARCRRQTLYSGRCVDCGGPTNGYNGPALAGDRCGECRARYQHENARWTRETVVEAILRWAEEHGRPPTGTQWNTTMARAAGMPERDPSYPVTNTVVNVFGSWADAIEAAGFRRPRRGPRPKVAA